MEMCDTGAWYEHLEVKSSPLCKMREKAAVNETVKACWSSPITTESGLQHKTLPHMALTGHPTIPRNRPWSSPVTQELMQREITRRFKSLDPHPVAGRIECNFPIRFAADLWARLVKMKGWTPRLPLRAKQNLTRCYY